MKNARLIGLVQSPDGNSYVLAQPYPYKGTLEEKRNVVREAMLKHPLLRSIRQFIALGDALEDAMRKAATVAGEENYDGRAIAPLVTWAAGEGALDPSVRVEVLVNEAVAAKEARHVEHAHERVVFISHSSNDKPFVRKLAADLVALLLWRKDLWVIDEQNRIQNRRRFRSPKKIAQGLAESDFLSAEVIVFVSQNSANSVSG